MIQLPPTIRTSLGKHLYRDLIRLFPIMQGNQNDFYSKYLEKLTPRNFDRGNFITKVGRLVHEVYFIVKGTVMNFNTRKEFRAGHMINHDCVYKNEMQEHNYVAIDEVINTFAFTNEVFLEVVGMFPDFRRYIEKEVIGKQKSIEKQNKWVKEALNPETKTYIDNHFKTIWVEQTKVIAKQQKSKALKLNKNTPEMKLLHLQDILKLNEELPF